MSLLEKYLEDKKEMYAKFDEIRKASNDAIDAIGEEFLDKFKTMVADASEEEFHEFLCNSGDELDDIERMAALTARLEGYTKRSEDEPKNTEDTDDKSKKDGGPHVVIIGIG